MSKPADLNRPIIESLYAEALLLADDVRASFDFAGRIDAMVEDEDLARIALSCEALRTTTRMMHVIAWLLNQRAFFNGEISEFQLRRSGDTVPLVDEPGLKDTSIALTRLPPGSYSWRVMSTIPGAGQVIETWMPEQSFEVARRR